MDTKTCLSLAIIIPVFVLWHRTGRKQSCGRSWRTTESCFVIRNPNIVIMRKLRGRGGWARICLRRLSSMIGARNTPAEIRGHVLETMMRAQSYLHMVIFSKL